MTCVARPYPSPYFVAGLVGGLNTQLIFPIRLQPQPSHHRDHYIPFSSVRFNPWQISIETYYWTLINFSQRFGREGPDHLHQLFPLHGLLPIHAFLPLHALLPVPLRGRVQAGHRGGQPLQHDGPHQPEGGGGHCGDRGVPPLISGPR